MLDDPLTTLLISPREAMQAARRVEQRIVLEAVGSEWDTTRIIAQRLGWGTARVRRHLMALAERGLLHRRSGEQRDGRWHYFEGWQWQRNQLND